MKRSGRPFKMIVMRQADWRELNVALDGLMRWKKDVPNEPKWPPGSEGRYVQKIRVIIAKIRKQVPHAP